MERLSFHCELFETLLESGRQIKERYVFFRADGFIDTKLAVETAVEELMYDKVGSHLLEKIISV